MLNKQIPCENFFSVEQLYVKDKDMKVLSEILVELNFAESQQKS
jgi:hypothetical protein